MLNNNLTAPSVSKPILAVLLIAGIPFLYCYFMFFAFHGVIIHTNVPSAIMISQLVDQHVSLLNEHDGIERNVLLLMFLIIGPAGFLLYHSKMAPKLLTVIGILLWLIFLTSLHFFTNLFSALHGNHVLNCAIVLFSFTGMVLVWRWLYYKNLFLARLLIAETLILICFIPYTDISYYDYAFVLAPALKVIQAGKISAAYFQYDLLPSIPAWFVLKHGGGVYDYRFLMQVGVFAFLISAFLVARRFFTHKSLAFYLLALLVIVRVFMGMNEMTYIPQITSVRLDWWLLLFACSYLWGIDNFKFGICLLLLIVLLNSFGFIYLFCYFALLVFLLAFQCFTGFAAGGALSLMPAIQAWFKQYLPNMALGFAGLVIHWLVTGHIVNESILIYKDFQIGMLPVLPDSLYWYFAAVFTFCFALLLVFKDRFKPAYWTSSLLLLFLFIGNSVYFFGRSHENNVINIAGILLFAVVLCADILLQLTHTGGQPLKTSQKLAGIAPVGFILLVLMITRSDVFVNNTGAYIGYAKSKHWGYQESMPKSSELATIADITGNSKKIYFMTFDGADFFFYYRGKYNMPARFIPIDTWILKSEKIAFANQKLAEGYYVVAIDNDNIFNRDLLPGLNYKNKAAKNGFVAFSN